MITKLNFLKELTSPKGYKNFFYGGLCLYIISLFDRIPPGFMMANYYFIFFVILMTLVLSNNKLAVHKYYTVNNLAWNMVLFQIILIIYVIAILLLQNVLGIDGLENLLVLLTAGILYGYFILLTLINIIAIPVEFILRKTKRISNYNIVNPSKIFKFIIYNLSISLTGFICFCLYIMIEAFKNID